MMNTPTETNPTSRRIPTFRRLFGLVINRRTPFFVVLLASLVVLGYAVENWRGHRAWQRCKAELEAKGEVLDWSAYVPKPVPDAENMMKVSLVESLFIRSSREGKAGPSSGELGRLNTKIGASLATKAVGGLHGSENVTLAQVVVQLPDSSIEPTPGDTVLALSDLESGRSEVSIPAEALPTGRSLPGARSDTLIERSPTGRPPWRLYLRAGRLPKAKELEDLFNQRKVLRAADEIRVYPTAATNVFRLGVSGIQIYVADDYLAATAALEADFDVIREAARRRYAAIDGDYNVPFDTPYPNFIAVRTVCQIAAERAQACLLLGRPEQALHELSLIQAVRRVLGAGQPTLVATMIDVAVVGLYVQVVEQGFEAGAWQGPQRRTLETQLRQIHLLPAYARSIRGGERAAVAYLLEHCPRRTLARLLVGESKPLWKSPAGLYVLLCPRGWLDQTAALVARTEQAELDCLDLKQSRIDVYRESAFASRLDAEFHRPLAYDTVVAGMLVPNFSRACQVVARNQTFVDQAQIACALERYRKASGAYPETLGALVPRYLDELPYEIVNGQPLKYHRTADGDYRLYSVGWDLRDDGGERGARGFFDRSEKDWVWR